MSVAVNFAANFAHSASLLVAASAHAPASVHAHAHAYARASAPASVRVAGTLAYDALRASTGMTRAVPGFEATPFRFAGNDIVWIGTHAPLHPRVLLLAEETSSMRLDVETATVYQPETLGGQRFSRDALRKPLVGAILGVTSEVKSAGFGGLLAGVPLIFPLSHRADAAIALAQACADDDTTIFTTAATRLLGVGAGITPSGDDFVGGALFAQRLVASSHDWDAVSASIITNAAERTHIISRALLADLTRGASYAPLHALAAALVQDDTDAALAAARELITIGHSSGWDMLAGFTAGLTGTLKPS